MRMNISLTKEANYLRAIEKEGKNQEKPTFQEIVN
jgi:hypothetical protein